MPKERRERSVSRASPYPSGSGCSEHSLPKNPLESDDNIKEWEDARCPVCMEHPHNAILLLCASHEKGCRPFMCDTSYRHSNCYDQFKKSFEEASTTPTQEYPVSPSSPSLIPEPPLAELITQRGAGGSNSVQEASCDDDAKLKLVCPLCRQDIKGFMVVENARGFMNSKLRSCACETCEFSGTYRELRNHAREAHPLVRPTEADPERQRSWRRLEQQRDLGDLLSTLQSSFGDETNEDSSLSIDDGQSLTLVILVRILRSGGNSTRASSGWSGSSNSSTHARYTTRRLPSRRLWGDWETDSRDDNNETSDATTPPPPPPPRGNRNNRANRRSEPDN